MNASNNDIDPFEDFFHDRFSEFESDVDEALWAKIEPQLPLPSFSRLMLWHLAASVVLLLLSFVLLPKLLLQPEHDETLSYTTKSIESALKEGTTVAPKSKNEWSSNKNTNAQKTNGLESINSTGTNELDENEKNTHAKNEMGFSTKNRTIASTDVSPSESVVSTTAFKKRIPKSGVVIPSKNAIRAQKRKSNRTFSGSSSIEEYDRIVRSTQNTGDYLANNNEELAPNLEILASKEPMDLSVRFNKARIKTPPRNANRYFQPTKAVSLYFSAMPLVNYYTITPNSADNKYVHNIQIDDDNSRIGVYLQGGLKFTLTDRLQLKTGLSYTKSSQSISFKVRTDSLVVRSVDNKTADVAFEEQDRSYTMSSHYLGTRVDLEYTFLKGSALSHHVLLGIEGNTSLNGSAAGKINSFVNLGYGVSRQIGDNAYLFIEPTMSIALNHQSDDSALLLVRPNKIGFNIGLNFKIK